ncbi:MULTISPECIES: HTH-type transcriptional activator IlvY [Rheinheimera]|uniref:HTH-type transcriptional activator IlvY n=1 Tax=Rheinheimera marina TaxID=1774958 RepID=A0ABV9JM33_9GAMM
MQHRMDIRTAQLFLHLASSLNFARTSEQMYVSPSTLSRTIQRLEQELNVELFIRDNRSVRLTAAGIRLQGFVKSYLEQWHQLQLDLNQNSANLTGEIRLFCTVTASFSHLPAILDKFRLVCPLAEIKLITGDAGQALDKVKQDEADIALAVYPEHLPMNMAFRSIAKVQLQLIAPVIPCKANDLLSQNPVPWDQVPLILPEHGPLRDRFEHWRKPRGIEPKIVAKVEGHEAMVSMVALGTGVALAPSIVALQSPAKDRVRFISQQNEFEPFDLGLCVLSKRLHEPLLRAFWQVASELN